MMNSSCMNAPRIMVFRPTMEEMKDFSSYIAHMESKGAHLAGVAKVIPPKEFVPRKNYDDLDMVIPSPIQQEVMGHQGLYTQYNIQKKPMTVKEYRKIANSSKYCTPTHFDYEDLERKYWKNITYSPPIYGADISGSIYDKGWNIWNINRLNTILDLIEEEEGVKIEGVNTAYLYFGMWKTTFAWHTEDMDLYSINYIHYGAPKTWYAIPTEHARRLERLASGFFPGSFADCPSFLRHKMTVIAPYILKKYSIPFDKITQEVGEFMITFPYGYHSGFNHGYNIAESTNFASLRWIDYGKRASSCSCSKDSVKIGMDPFVRVFQPDRYQAWIEGRDVIFIPEVDGPTPPTVTHKQPPKSPEKTKDKALSKVHRRHPVHKKGLHTDIKPKSEGQEKSKDGIKVKKEKLKSEEKKKHHHQDHYSTKSKGHKSVLLSDEKKLKKKKKKNKKRKHSKDHSVEGSPSKMKKISFKSPVIKVQHICDLSQLAEAAERVAAGSLDLPIKVEPGADGDSVFSERTEPGDISNITQNSTGISDYWTVNALPALPESEHSYSSTLSSKAKRKKQKKPTKSHKSNTKEKQLEDVLLEVKQEPVEPVKDSGKVSERGSSLIPTRTNADGTSVGSHKGFSSRDLSTMKNWVRSLNGLWIIQPAQFVSEQVHNISMADQKPGCCVCRIFYNEKHDNLDWGDEDTAFSSSVSQVAGTSQDQRLRVLCPEMCFACSPENPFPVLENMNLGSDGRSPILNCVSCKIAVHASCYGVDPSTPAEEWKCDRCKQEDWQAICCLCNLRGGALKPTTTQEWAHIVCAMAITEVSFENVKLRGPINVTNLSPARLKLKCYFCRSFIKCSHKRSSCIQCSVGKCALAFHVTCAKAAGVLMEPSDWPYPVYATCSKHPFANKDLSRRVSLKVIVTGEKVIAKHKNSRFYEAEVIREKEQMFCHVNFTDNSFSENLFPEDIESHNILQDGPPREGARVKVRWTDGVLYDGAYVKDSLIKIYDVEFADGAVMTVKREDIYAQGEALPKKVKIRLSVASEMRHEDFYGNVVKGKHRQVSSRYASQSSDSADQSESNDPADSNILSESIDHSSSVDHSGSIDHSEPIDHSGSSDHSGSTSSDSSS